jgi:2-methylcitrate dehydratase PrpD
VGSDCRSRRVAGFVHELRWDDIPAVVQAQAVRCALDLCGSALAGSSTPVARTVSDYAREAHGSGSCTVIGTARRSTPTGAALANGFAASALDIDDGYRPVKGHPGAVVFPAVLAAAEEAGASGREFLTALVVTYEVSMRAGCILHSLYDFYHGSGAWGPVGAAAGAARLFGCDVEEIRHTLGIAEFHAPMTPEMRSIDHPSMLKDGIGWGAMVGLSSAKLAGKGFTGIPSLFDEEEADPASIESLGHEYLIRDLYFKPHPCCRWAQPAVEGALAAARELDVNAEEISRIRVHTFEAATRLRSTAPRTTEEAQFSLPWPVACALIDGVIGPDQMLEQALTDPARQELAARVKTVHDPELERAFPAQALARVEIEASDGRRARSEVMAAQGDAEARPSDEEFADKFESLAEPVLGSGRAAELTRAIQTLPEAADLDTLTALLRPPGR